MCSVCYFIFIFLVVEVTRRLHRVLFTEIIYALYYRWMLQRMIMEVCIHALYCTGHKSEFLYPFSYLGTYLT